MLRINVRHFQSVDLLGNKNKISREKLAQLQLRIADRKLRGRNQDGDWYLEQNCPKASEFLKVVIIKKIIGDKIIFLGLSKFWNRGDDRPQDG